MVEQCHSLGEKQSRWKPENLQPSCKNKHMKGTVNKKTGSESANIANILLRYKFLHDLSTEKSLKSKNGNKLYNLDLNLHF